MTILKKIREIMNENKIDAYYINSSDYHQSEYIGDYFRVREFISGFTGSNGDLIITKNQAGLWTDGRYAVQARKQLENSEINVFVLDEKNYVEKKDWLKDNLSEGYVLGFDGKVVSAKFGQEIKKNLSEKKILINENINFIDKVWKGRPSLPKEKVFLLDEKYSGKSAEQKLADVKSCMKKEKIDYILIASLDDIAWLLNIRGHDIKYTPVALSYMLISIEKVYLYIDDEKLSKEIINILEKNVEIKKYEAIYEEAKNISSNKNVWVDLKKINFSLYRRIESTKIKDSILPTSLMKAIKDNIEIENTKKAHIKDGVAVTKFIHWLKNNIGKIEINEISAAKKIEEFRGKSDSYIEPSFTTISAYMGNAAMPHYSAKDENFSRLEKKGLYLVDSGGQYFEGTTDVTRTIALGKISDEIKRDFTLVLKGMLAVANVKFLEGTVGLSLDILARKAMWEYGINYNHGTGHGIGHVLGVHEGPHSIASKFNSHSLKEGMIVTDEPGIYVDGSHGIRTEIELLVKEYKTTSYGKFLQFEILTFVPIDLDLIDFSFLTSEEKLFLNDYHREVFEKISPFLEKEEVQWLKSYTKEI
ncbi:MAG: aminopeptidase P family protein [Fusobacteriaceae bacterium]